MENISTHHIFYRRPYTPEDEFSEPSTYSRPIRAFGYELHPDIIAMVRKKPFSGLEDKDPYNHLQLFEELCLCLVEASPLE